MIGVIVINYHSEEKTIEFVRTELAKIRSDYAVVIVDNGSTELSRDRLLEAFKGADQYVFVAPSEENLGFAKGNNLGAEVAVNQFNPDVLLFANNDIRLGEPDVVERMADKLRSLEGVGAWGRRSWDLTADSRVRNLSSASGTGMWPFTGAGCSPRSPRHGGRIIPRPPGRAAITGFRVRSSWSRPQTIALAAGWIPIPFSMRRK